MSEQTVNLPDEMVQAIQQCAMDRKEPVKGAVQRTLERGAALALAEKRGELSVNDGNISLTTNGSVDNPTFEGYNSLHVVEAARRAAKSLSELAADLATAVEKDATAKKDRTDRLGAALRDAMPHAQKLNKELAESVDRLSKRGQKSEGKSRKVK